MICFSIAAAAPLTFHSRGSLIFRALMLLAISLFIAIFALQQIRRVDDGESITAAARASRRRMARASSWLYSPGMVSQTHRSSNFNCEMPTEVSG